MRLLHTSDWHLGRSLHGIDLLEYQAEALDHIVTTAQEERVDAVLVAGDVFDRAIPPVEAVRLLAPASGSVAPGRVHPVRTGGVPPSYLH
jgi:DNA repair protein SbcD/Mre11